MDIKAKVKTIKQNIVILVLALSKKETPWYAKALVGLTVAYALSPIDLIPDFIPILGYLDDIVILPLLIILSYKLIPKKVIQECILEKQTTTIEKKWVYAIPIVLIWIAIFYAITIAIIKQINFTS